MVEVGGCEGAVVPVDKQGNVNWKQLMKNLNWDVVPFLFCQHVLSLVGLLAIFLPSLWTECTGFSAPTIFTIGFSFSLWPITGIGVTAASMADQSTIWGWAHVHRAHHQFSDTARDPHNRRYGFFYTHIGWIISYLPQAACEAINGVDMDDLYKDPVVMFQCDSRIQPWWNLFWCYVFPTIVCMYYGHDTWLNGLIIAGFTRHVFVMHCTWLVNSLSHCGEQDTNGPYNHANNTKESAIVSFFAIGEGWHNWHHAYPWDYAAAELDWWQQYNPTKLFIDVMAMTGLVSRRRRATKLWNDKLVQLNKVRDRNVKRVDEGRSANRKVYHFDNIKGYPPFQYRHVNYEMCLAENKSTASSEGSDELATQCIFGGPRPDSGPYTRLNPT